MVSNWDGQSRLLPWKEMHKWMNSILVFKLYYISLGVSKENTSQAEGNEVVD